MRQRLPVFRGDFALACLNIPVHRQEFPVRFSQGISAEPLGNVGSFDASKQPMTHPIYEFPVIFPDRREFERRDGFESDCSLSQGVLSLRFDFLVSKNRRYSRGLAW